MNYIARILIIEDDFIVREIIKTILESEAFEVIEAEQGIQGIELAQQYGPDLIISDIIMPNFSGYDVFKELTAQENTSRIPFIFISAKAHKSDLRFGMEMGADDYITKPFTRNELIGAVKSRLEKHKNRQKFFEKKIKKLDKKVNLLEKKIDELIKKRTSEIFSPTQGWQGRFEQVAITSENIRVLVKELHRALEEKEFELYYQPQVDCQTGKIVGAEALLRWQHPTRGLVYPAQFIPIAETQGLIEPIGDWVLKTVCQQMKQWQNQLGFNLKRVAANVSAKQLNSSFGENLFQIIAETELEPQYLELELTESIFLESVAETQNLLNRLKNWGIHTSIDDFGTGYSSLNYLQHLSFDQLKIDRSFITDIHKYPKKQALVKLMIDIGHTLQLTVLAEGVETEAELAILKEQQCDEFQGYLFSRPLPVAEMEALLKGDRRS